MPHAHGSNTHTVLSANTWSSETEARRCNLITQWIHHALVACSQLPWPCKLRRNARAAVLFKVNYNTSEVIRKFHVIRRTYLLFAVTTHNNDFGCRCWRQCQCKEHLRNFGVLQRVHLSILSVAPCPCSAARQKDVWGSGGRSPVFLEIGTRWK
jgi:hypothetical protein